MKIRALLAGMVLALASACTAEAVLPDSPAPGPSFDGSTPSDTTTRSGGGMGSGN
jgi:hypothetical protein